jgi:hypothetical protein
VCGWLITARVSAAIGDRECCAPAYGQESQYASQQTQQPKPPLDDRLALEALRLKETAKALRHGPEKLAMLRKARQLDDAVKTHFEEALPGVYPTRDATND